MRTHISKTTFLIFVIIFWFVLIGYHLIYNVENLELSQAWHVNRSRNVSVYILPYKDTVIYLPNNFCDKNVFLLVFICSAPEHFAVRKTIRETWAARKVILDYKVDFYFFVGRSSEPAVEELVGDEFKIYDDIVQEHFWENYYNLTLKSLFILKNVERRCLEKVEYVLKIDDDVYLNIFNLVTELSSKHERKNLIMGHLFDGAQPIRSARNKWYAPRYLYEDSYYPPFVSGSGYVMSIDVVQRLLNASWNRPLLHLEDVYITGILSKDIGVTPVDNSFFSDKKMYFSPCAYINLITSHGYTSSELSALYAKVSVSNLTELCAREQRCRHFLSLQ